MAFSNRESSRSAVWPRQQQCRSRCLWRSAYWRSRPLVFSFVPRCHGLLAEEDVQPSAYAVGRAVPRPRSVTRSDQEASSVDRIADGFGAMPRKRPFTRVGHGRHARQVEQHRESGGAFDQCRSRTSDDQVAFPGPGTARSLASAGRSLIMMSEPTNSLPRPRRRALGTRSARPVRKHAVSSRRSAPRPVQRLVNRLVRDPIDSSSDTRSGRWAICCAPRCRPMSVLAAAMTSTPGAHVWARRGRPILRCRLLHVA